MKSKVLRRPRNRNRGSRTKGRSNAVHSRINIQGSNGRKGSSTGFLKSMPISLGCVPARMAGAKRSSIGRPVEDQGVMITVMETISRRPLQRGKREEQIDKSMWGKVLKWEAK